MCKIARDNGNLQDEKQYLERIINAASDKALIKNIMRLEKVNLLLEKQKEENTLQIDFTEEDRKTWIDKLAKDFKYGQLSLTDIDQKIKEARNYPNYVKSLIELLDIKSMMTEDFQSELAELNDYLENEPSISKEDYKDVLDAMSAIKNKIDYKKVIDSYESENNDDGR